MSVANDRENLEKMIHEWSAKSLLFDKLLTFIKRFRRKSWFSHRDQVRSIEGALKAMGNHLIADILLTLCFLRLRFTSRAGTITKLLIAKQKIVIILCCKFLNPLVPFEILRLRSLLFLLPFLKKSRIERKTLWQAWEKRNMRFRIGQFSIRKQTSWVFYCLIKIETSSLSLEKPKKNFKKWPEPSQVRLLVIWWHNAPFNWGLLLIIVINKLWASEWEIAHFQDSLCAVLKGIAMNTPLTTN